MSNQNRDLRALTAAARRSRSPGAPCRLPPARFFMLAALAVVVGGVGLTHLRAGGVVSTRDARVQAARTVVSTQAGGTIAEVDVRDGQFVKRGQVLLRLDDRHYRLAVIEATAILQQARLRIAALRAAYSQHLADLASAAETLRDRRLELTEDRLLVPAGLLPPSAQAQASRAVRMAREDAAHARDGAAEVLAQLSGDATLPASDYPAVRIAQARLDHAVFEQSLTVVVAPSSGMVDGAGHLKPGTGVRIGMPVFVLLSGRKLWVEAAFKETEVANVHAGDAAIVRLGDGDGRRWPAHVVSVSPETVAMLRGKPVDGAAPNWQKKVQRVPVRLAFDQRLNSGSVPPGVRVEVAVSTRHRTRLLRLAARKLRSIGFLR